MKLHWMFLLLGLLCSPSLAAPVGPVPYSALPNCTDTAGQHLNVSSATGAFSCGTSGGTSIATCTATCTVSYAANGALIRIIAFGQGGCGGGGSVQSAPGSVAPAGAGGGGGFRFDNVFLKATLGSSTTFTFGTPCTAGAGATVAGNPGIDGGDGASIQIGSTGLFAYGGGGGMGGSPGVFGNASRGGGGGSAHGPGINGRTSGATGACWPTVLYFCGTPGAANGSSPNMINAATQSNQNSTAGFYGGSGGCGSTAAGNCGGGDGPNCPGGGSGGPIDATNTGFLGGYVGQAAFTITAGSPGTTGAVGGNGPDAIAALVDFWGGNTAFGGGAGTAGNGGDSGGPGNVPCVGGSGGGASAGGHGGAGGLGGMAIVYVIQTLGS